MTLLVFDEVDTICPKRDDRGYHVTDRTVSVVANFLSNLDGPEAHPGVMILGMTNRQNEIDDAMRRPGRFDVEIEFDVPGPQERLKILHGALSDCGMPVEVEVKGIEELAKTAHGFVGADLISWVVIAARKALMRDLFKPVLILEDLTKGRASVKPSGMRDLTIDVPNTKWTDIGGYQSVKEQLIDCVQLPITHREHFDSMNLTPPKGVLLFGPPGNSKTIMARAVATESSMNFISVKGPELFSKWVGETEQTIRNIFNKARRYAPTVIFFDEIDGLASKRTADSHRARSSALAQLLTEIDGISNSSHVVIIGATNRPEMLDSAILRPGRFDRLVYVSLPESTARAEIFKVHLRNISIEPDENFPDFESMIKWLTDSSEGLSGAEIAMVCKEAKIRTLRSRIQTGNIPSNVVDFSTLQEVLKTTAPRTTKESVEAYERFVQTLKV